MKIFKKIVASCLAFTMVVVLVDGCPTVSAAAKPKLSQKKLVLKVGQTKKLKVKKVKKKVKWSTNKKKIATVSKKGLVKARKPGKAVITAKVSGKKLKCKVTVKAKSKKSSTNASGTNNQSRTTTVPGASSQPGTTTVPDSSSQPGTTVLPGSSGQPGVTALPGASDQPGASSQPGTTTVPGTSSQPGTTTLPGTSSQPGTTTLPGSSSQPGTTTVPGTSSQPGTTVLPGTSSQPGMTSAPGSSSDPGQTQEPTIALNASRGSGTYESAFQLTLNSDPGTTIYYTLDGSNPVTSETRQTYSGGISITDRKNDPNVLSSVPPSKIQTMHKNSDLITPSKSAVDKCTVLRAVAVGDDGEQSDIMTNTYFIGNMSQHISGIQDSVQAAGKNLAVISITMDQNDLFDETKGIYAIGNDKDAPNFKKKGREWERSCHIDYFESDGTETSLELAQDCGIRIQGNYSRENVQKSFRLYAREDYGIKNFKYPFFSGLTNAEGKTMKKFKTLVLRNGGNDSFNYKYKDNIMQSFLHEQECETLHGRPCVVYLDGEYWGHYVLQDDVSDNFLQEKRGVVKENVVVYKGSDDPQYLSYGYKLDEGELPAGETDESYYLRETLQFLDSHDLSEDAAYQEFIEKYMSEDSAVDYFAIMLYLNNRYDWPGKNWSIWRTLDDDRNNQAYEDGRWRFCIYDMDLTTNTTWNGWGNLEGVSEDQIFNLAKDVGGNIPKKLYSNMMKNASYREKLADKIKKLSTEVFTEALADARGEEYLGTYRPLHEQFRKRFLASNDDGLANSNQNDNIAWLKQRLSYVDTLVSNIQNFNSNSNGSGNGNSSSFGDADTILPLQNNTLIWQGKWSRTDSGSNETTAKTNGFSLISSDGNFMQWSIDKSIWDTYQKPMLQLTVADGAAANARCHIWGEKNSDMNQYFYLQSGDQVYPWTTQAIDISGISSNVFCVNANDAQLIEVRVFEGATTGN